MKAYRLLFATLMALLMPMRMAAVQDTIQVGNAFYICSYTVSGTTLNPIINPTGAVLIVYNPNATATSFTIPSQVTDTIRDKGKLGSIQYVNFPVKAIYGIARNGTTIRGAFQSNTSLRTVHIPSSVENIGDNAFRSSSVTTITFDGTPSLTTISKYAFSGCSRLKNFTFPSSLTSIGNYAFQNCTSLTDAVLPDGLTTLGTGAFKGCTSLAGYSYGNITTIPVSAYEGCTGIKFLGLGGSPTAISANAFKDCTGITQIDFGSNIASIDATAFAGCTALSTVKAPWATPPIIDEQTFPNCENATLKVPAGTVAAYQAAPGWRNFGTITDGVIHFADATVKTLLTTSYIGIDSNGDGEVSEGEAASATADQIQDAFRQDASRAATITSFDEFQYFTGLTEISNSTFSYCTALKSVTLPTTITSIGNFAFDGCAALENIVLNEGLTTIGRNAFEDYTGIVTLPSTVTSIDFKAFYNCAGLKVSWTTPPDYNNLLESQQFGPNNADPKKPLYVPIGSYDAYHVAGWWRFDVREYGIIHFADANVKAICVSKWDTNGDGELSAEEAEIVESWNFYSVFQDNAEITSFDELKYFIGMTYIPESAFKTCTNLSSITLPRTITEVKGWALLGCTSLTSIDIPEGVKAIGQSAFYGCSSLTEIGLYYGLETIGEEAFTNTALEHFIIPGSVTSMDDAFRAQTTVIPQYVTAQWWEPIAITENTFPMRAQATLFVPEGKEDVYRAAPYWQDFGTIVAKIEFNDPAVKAVCISNFDSNGDGELTLDEAAAVTTLGTAFKGNTEIRSFDELKYFTGLDDGTEWHNHVLTGEAFMGCSSLVTVTLPANITQIYNRAFQNCTSLKYVNGIPDAVRNLGDSSFEGCTSLEYITLPASIGMINNGLFNGCSSLRWITIPEGVTFYGNEAFAGCTALTQVTVKNPTPATGGNIYGDPFPTRANINLIVPAHAQEAYSTADYWKDFFSFKELEPSWLQYTDENGDIYQYEPGYSAQLYRFADNSSRTSFVMPSSIGVDGEVYPVTAIARLRSSYLQTLTIPASVTVVKDNGISCLIVPETGFTLKDIYMRGNVPEAGSFADWMVSIKQYNMQMETQYPGDPTKRVSLKDITLHVPTGLKAAYEAATFWKEFTVVEYSQPSNEAYAVLSTDGETLSFYYDCERSSREGTTYSLNTGSNKPGWADDAAVSGGLTAKVLTAVIDPSFTNARPTSTAYWFRQMNNLVSIAGLTYLNTSEVTCMDNMFYNCQNLAELDLSYFNTANVTSMRYMFIFCKSLTKLDLSSFDTGKVTSMFDMFDSCSKLESINLSSFNTTKVMDMSGMFSGCASLRMLDLTNFSTPALRNTAYMFNGCTDLTAIYVGSGWTMANVNTSAPDYYKKMFANCTSLLGCKGTAYSSAIPEIDLDYARIDGGTAAPGLLSYTPYAVLSTDGKTLTLYHDGDSSSKTGTVFSLIDRIPGWYQEVPFVTTVVFDPSFAFARPVSMRAWFYRLSYLTTFEGLQYLNTSEVRDMAVLFYACTQLTNLDLTTFNTSKVKDMANMFLFCTGLKTLDLSSFNTSQVKSMFQMFADCEQLTTIYAGDGWTTSALEGDGQIGLFLMADNLVGGNGTTYDDSPYSSDGVDAFYARIDAPGAPGYFTDKNAPKRGDVNGDGVVTIADVTSLVNVILGKSPAPASGVADVNGDHAVTIADVTSLVNIILGKH